MKWIAFFLFWSGAKTWIWEMMFKGELWHGVGGFITLGKYFYKESD